MKNAVLKFLKESKGFFVFILLMSVFRSGIADWNVVPTESMLPTIVAGDRILVNKLAYDIQLPFLYTSIKKLADPERGDIIIFDSKVSKLRLVKRVVGIPGDRVSMRNNILTINDKKLDYGVVRQGPVTEELDENLLGLEHHVLIKDSGSRLSSFDEIVVPAGEYLALGDNRDNSADSRVIGFVPRDEIIGRAKTVVMSLDYDNYYMPRLKRFWHTL